MPRSRTYLRAAVRFLGHCLTVTGASMYGLWHAAPPSGAPDGATGTSGRAAGPARARPETLRFGPLTESEARAFDDLVGRLRRP